jgi:hypothetical protein
MAKPNPATPIYHGRKWPVGLHNASRRLGCSPGHLYQVLIGKRQSPDLLPRYQELVVELKGKEAA